MVSRETEWWSSVVSVIRLWLALVFSFQPVFGVIDRDVVRCMSRRDWPKV